MKYSHNNWTKNRGRAGGLTINFRRYTQNYGAKSFIFLILIFLFGQYVLFGCKSKKDSKPYSDDAVQGLQFRLETDFSKSEYLLGETVIVRMYLRNTTDKNIVICLWPSREELTFTHYENNKPVIYKDSVLFDRPVSKDKSFITVRSGAEMHFATPQFGEEWQKKYKSKYFDKIGRWELKIIHYYDFSGERFGLKGWKGTLSSNILSITIAL